MTHEQYAAKKGRKLDRYQGRMELWFADDGAWLYNRDTHRWSKAHLTVA